MLDLFPVKLSYLIPLLPLLGAIVVGLFGARHLKQNSHWPIWIGVGLSAVLSILLCAGAMGVAHSTEGNIGVAKIWYTWMEAGAFKANAGVWLDPLTAVMLCVVCGIGFLITVFSAGYMKGEEGYWRFFAYLGLFIFMMTMLVMGENFLLLYLGWEGVGLCSYLLIGYYYDKPAAREAAKKAFLVNRVGDFGFGIGIMLIFYVFGTLSFFGDGIGTNTGVLEMVRDPARFGITGTKQLLIDVIPFCLMIGAFGKSAQFPLYVWLPDAMEGPTPVSALIHAATMVTAGIYMIARCGTLFVGNQAAMITIAVVGAFTALLAATIAMRQFDLKKVFAYSTVSQLGFMFVGVAVLAPVAGVFHLVTHAFFKALLFLSSGVVMHAMNGELDMRKMSGLKRALPKTRWLMLVGCAALAGIPPLAGFFSKDEIIASAWEHSKLLGFVLLFTAFLTAYYTFRLYFRVFHGPQVIPAGAHVSGFGQATHHVTAAIPADAHAASVSAHSSDSNRGHGSDRDTHHHNPEPFLLIAPLVLLAIGAALGGFLNFGTHALGDFLGKSPSFQQSFDRAGATYGQARVLPQPMGQQGEAAVDEALLHASHVTHWYIGIVSLLVAFAGAYVAFVLHARDRARADRLATQLAPATRAIDAKYWIDEIYQAAIVEPLRWLGRIAYGIDRIIIDGVVGLVGFVPQLFGFLLKLTTQQGYLQGYALTMLFGVMVILFFVFW